MPVVQILLARSSWLKALVTAFVAGGFVWLYEVTILDSRFAVLPIGLQRPAEPKVPVPGAHLTFSATAYCKGLITSSGVAVQQGSIAADPALLPLGTLVELDARDQKYNGIYTVLDTGP